MSFHSEVINSILGIIAIITCVIRYDRITITKSVLSTDIPSSVIHKVGKNKQNA